jgi:predicted nuclease of restriction endonuclease-like (RecB) superfamily
MSKQRKTVAKRAKVADHRELPAYGDLVDEIAEILETARRASARAVNAVMTATYWEIGRRIVEYEQRGKERAEYGAATLTQLSRDLTSRYGRGFGVDNLQRFRLFYIAYASKEIYATASRKSLTPLTQIADRFPLPWSAYVRLLAVRNENARTFYETEALRAGWSVRQLDRQIQSQFYERTALSRNKAEMLAKGARPQPDDAISPAEEIKDPYVLEFLGLRDEYSETDLEAALIHHLEAFLLELGGDFCFIGRQRRLRIGGPDPLRPEGRGSGPLRPR